ncbi:MAG: hypothetical protein F4W90_02860 [Gammaproteobacteria bacterium]|nr:hypothetical protein [Gammaproteobacteria bacterium]
MRMKWAKRLGIVSIGVVLAFTMSNVTGTSNEKCGMAFFESSANASCYPVYDGVVWEGNHSRCRVQVRCRRANPLNEARLNNQRFTIDETKKLHNCDGTLKVGGC